MNKKTFFGVMVALALSSMNLHSAAKKNIVPSSADLVQGKKLFTANCSACHMADQDFAGPSLIEVGHIYRNNPAGIAAWALKPGQKR